MRLRYRKDDHVHNVFVSVERWLRSRGVRPTLMSGIEIITMPEDRAFIYHVAVKVTGRRPAPEGEKG